MNELTKSSYPALEICSPRVSGLQLSGESALIGSAYDGLRVAILGARTPSKLGASLTREIARGIASRGGVIVSGLQNGIESEAHKGALDVNGLTVAVLPCGLDHIYPSKNEGLAGDIVSAGGLLLTEFQNDVKALPWHFPIRTRIISALADILIVPQGTLKGNARIGVDLAFAMGKRVYVVPGATNDPLAELPNDLIASGDVGVILNVDHALIAFDNIQGVK